MIIVKGTDLKPGMIFWSPTNPWHLQVIGGINYTPGIMGEDAENWIEVYFNSYQSQSIYFRIDKDYEIVEPKLAIMK
jgi:hypothetical protein